MRRLARVFLLHCRQEMFLHPFDYWGFEDRGVRHRRETGQNLAEIRAPRGRFQFPLRDEHHGRFRQIVLRHGYP